jgi:hypothetical protein
LGEATVTGAFGVAGASAAASGATPADPTWAAPDDRLTSCPADEPPEPLSPALAPVSPALEASPPLLGEATVTGALTVVGASAAALGEPSTAPTWADPAEPSVACPPEPDGALPLVVEADVAPLWLASPPLFGEATVTGALAVTGASAATPAPGSTVPTWAAPVEPVTSWPVCALATPGHRTTARVAAAAAHALRNICLHCSLLLERLRTLGVHPWRTGLGWLAGSG